jgi:hypothetical protein
MRGAKVDVASSIAKVTPDKEMIATFLRDRVRVRDN